ncbi:DUF6647 family protein [Desulfurivibrio sp. C05AmB]|uniref:DUF6647 family protein n=1 Tax=Desulfurivibrio sp. C05AmB TaxID=3374371 RepID=UPI00376F3922
MVSQQALAERFYGAKPPTQAYVCGLYDDETQTIFLPDECCPDDLLNQSTLLHELVHHVQEATGMVYPCSAARERLAYEQKIGVRHPFFFWEEKWVSDPNFAYWSG